MEKLTTLDNRCRNSAGQPQAVKGGLCECGRPLRLVGDGRFKVPQKLGCDVCEAERYRKAEADGEAGRARRRREKIDKQIEQVIPPLYRQARMEDLPPGLRAEIQAVDGMAGLYLWGLPGRGKTYAAAAMAREYIELDLPVARVRWEPFLMELRGACARRGRQESEVLGPRLDATLLILEDVGTRTGLDGKESDFANRTLHLILDGRIEQGLLTVITTNKSPEQIGATFDGRILSRIVGHFKILGLCGPDRRPLEAAGPSRQKDALNDGDPDFQAGS